MYWNIYKQHQTKYVMELLEGCEIGELKDYKKENLEKIQKQLDRRRPGQSIISTPRNEFDKLEIIIEGGTYTEYPEAYLNVFIRDTYYAANTYFDIPKRARLSLDDELYQNKFRNFYNKLRFSYIPNGYYHKSSDYENIDFSYIYKDYRIYNNTDLSFNGKDDINYNLLYYHDI